VTESGVVGAPLPCTSSRWRCSRSAISDFVYDEENDLFRFPDARFAFSREWSDVKLLQKRGYDGKAKRSPQG